MQSSLMAPSSHPADVAPSSSWREQAASILDEAKGAASLGLILAVSLVTFGLGDSHWAWVSLAGVPVWLVSRASHLL